MQNTTNYNLKKPEYTDFADIADINDNMDTIDAQLAAPTGDSADSTTTFTTSDTADGSASSWTTVPALASGETHKSLFAKMSQMFKNVRYLYKLLGTTDISSIGNGTVTNALSVLNANLEATTIRRRIYSIRPNSSGKYSLYADGYTISNIVNVVAYTSNMELTCTVSSYAGSLYLYIKKPDGTVYGNQDVTINVTYYGPIVS